MRASWRPLAGKFRNVEAREVKAVALRNLALAAEARAAAADHRANAAATGSAEGESAPEAATPSILLVDLRSRQEVLASRDAEKESASPSASSPLVVGGLIPTAVHLPFQQLEAHLRLSLDSVDDEGSNPATAGASATQALHHRTEEAEYISAQVFDSVAPPPPLHPSTHQLVFYCASGIRSLYAMHTAEGFGFRGLAHFPDGYKAYAADPISSAELARFTEEWNANAAATPDAAAADDRK